MGKRKSAQLIVRNIDESLVKILKIRAAQHGRSAETEHREILGSHFVRRVPPDDARRG
jgi:plasmid stability protein